jgi:hypothetical protein
MGQISDAQIKQAVEVCIGFSDYRNMVSSFIGIRGLNPEEISIQQAMKVWAGLPEGHPLKKNVDSDKVNAGYEQIGIIGMAAYPIENIATILRP